MEKSENFIQQQCWIWFTNSYCLTKNSPRLLMFSVPNEGESAWETKRKKRIGLMPGASDMIVVYPKGALFLEFKTDTGRQSPAQKVFQERVEALGHRYYLIRSLTQFQELCKKLF